MRDVTLTVDGSSFLSNGCWLNQLLPKASITDSLWLGHWLTSFSIVEPLVSYQMYLISFWTRGNNLRRHEPGPAVIQRHIVFAGSFTNQTSKATTSIGAHLQQECDCDYWYRNIAKWVLWDFSTRPPNDQVIEFSKLCNAKTRETGQCVAIGPILE